MMFNVPKGWKLVPVEPTEELILAGDAGIAKAFTGDFIEGEFSEHAEAAYRAMLAAAPQYIPPPIVNYVTCERHMGMSYTIKGTFYSTMYGKRVCPICEPPTDSPA